MTTKSADTKSAVESSVAEKYRQKGYQVIIEPKTKDLPFDLGTFRPDLLVKISEHDGYIVEIKSSATKTSIDRYREIAELVAQHSGWRFLLVTGEDALVDIPDGNEEKPLTDEQIVRRKEQAERFIARGENEAAFLALWGILEALMRRQAESASLPIERFPTTSLIKHLYSQGELSMEQFDKVMALQAIRNRLVHGFQTTDVDDTPQQLQELVNELLHLWGRQ